MISDQARDQIVEALRALRKDDPWTALQPMQGLTEAGVSFYFDLSTLDDIGAPVVIAAPGPVDVLQGLTPRQREVAQLVAQGAANKDIARRLNIAPSTVKDHVHAILTRLGVGSRGEVAALVHGAKPRPRL